MTNPDPVSVEQAQADIRSAIERATDRYVQNLCGTQDPVRFADLAAKPAPAMVHRIVRSVEQSFWKREIERRAKDTRFQHADPNVVKASEAWNAALRSAMVLSKKELRQLINRALTLQIDAIISPIDCMNANVFSKKESVPGANAVVIATHLGIEERFVRALTHLVQDRGDKPITIADFRRVARDVDAKEFHGSRDLIALANLTSTLEVLGISSPDDEAVETPVPLARSFAVLCGTPEGTEKVIAATEKKSRIGVLELQDLFISREEMTTEQPPAPNEEVSRFLADLGVDDEIVMVDEGEAATGGVRFILTDEEKLAYVSRAIGRRTDLIEPIMKSIEGVLTWEEVDRVIDELVPDDDRQSDLQAGSFRSRI